MAIRKTTLPLLYTESLSAGWVRTLRSCVDEGVAALCIRKWQRVPITVSAQGPKPQAQGLQRVLRTGGAQ